ncbi:class I adenylate-forming enzyme family protein [Streptomyces triticirhizae]|uniref:Long-chain fatty acid--CoA ligase n=1 Tax=Streptomyces triticirhizae TaxID=2483353 RepID=A0A3M2LJ35_9ACTN|nr:class I adenylate-forming enzyme family protein [Streptomyces triticirhizae]RMI36025.1 long-chain fatty acid--CoA ligase [Streptomyces triticirhizae]
MRDPVSRLDDLPRIAARNHQDRVAVRTDRGESLTFGELERRVDACAARIAALTEGPGTVVALTSALHPDFVVAYYGALRAGRVVVPVNPMLRAEGLARLVAASGAALVLTVPEIAERLDTDVPAVDLADPSLVEGPPGDRAPVEPGDVACVHFTSGTTGAPKGVCQTHHNLAVNAAQTAHAHGLGPDSVTLNHLPTFHPMHLNAALFVGAEQVLATDPDLAASLRTANEVGAHRYYSLPMRLSRLAAHPELSTMRLTSVEAVYSGGSALPVAAASRLSEHFGIPVLQGYGLAETSPMTHCGDRSRPKPGSCGPPVPRTECRIVDLTTGKPVGTGERGEIQVRGPQLMKGYLGEPAGAAFDAEGWFATGDVGLVDEDGELFVVDRLKDVFKCDNELVSPQEVEGVLLRHPSVVDCVVVDHPDPFSGAVAAALVVAPKVPDQPALDAVAAEVNAELPSYQHIRHIRAVPEIARSGGGKVRRQELRQQLATLLTAD